MSILRHTGFYSRRLPRVAAMMIISIGGLVALGGCSSADHDNAVDPDGTENLSMRDPLPGDLVREYLMEDSVKNIRREGLRKSMTKILTEYRKKFRHEYFTGYFMTDLDHDGLPELWVKVGNYRDNAKLELYYPMPDGSLKKSDTFAEPGQYYVGDDYIIQVVGSGPGYINVNRISIKNGSMRVDNENGIDLYADPEANIPVFAERAIRDSSFHNLTALDRALRL